MEAYFHAPDSGEFTEIGLVCHPNPEQGGTMNNKVVTTIAKTYNMQGYASLRFNYRGVGKSAGSYGNITGEEEDCMAVIAWLEAHYPDAKLHIAGFSFGAYIAAYAATKVPTESLITVAPSVERMPYNKLGKVTCPWLVIMGEDDDVVRPQAVYDWYAQLDADKQLVKFPETGHFFHGKLKELRETILARP